MPLIDDYAEKWKRKAIQGFEQKWSQVIRQSTTFDDFVSGISDVTGISESAVRSSFAGQNFKKFQEDPEQYKQIALKKIRRAAEQGKWKENYMRAFGGR